MGVTKPSGDDIAYVGNKGISMRALRDNWWAMKINVPVSGSYTPKAHYGMYDNGGKQVDMSYYLIPATSAGVMKDLSFGRFEDEVNPIGSVNCTKTGTDGVSIISYAFRNVRKAPRVRSKALWETSFLTAELVQYLCQ